MAGPRPLDAAPATTTQKVFDKVIVITDRRVLDRQMRRQIAQFEQVAGVVRSVTDSSTELLEALRSASRRRSSRQRCRSSRSCSRRSTRRTT